MTVSLSRSCSARSPARRDRRWPSLFRAFGVAKERRALARLDDALLKDIGVTPDAARRECCRWFWDLPR